jgi:putative ABC transport system permease protein
MRLGDYFAAALENIRAAKLRSFLTSLGIIIGIGSVVLLIAIGQGVSETVTGAFADLGSTRITVTPGAPRGQGLTFGPGSGAASTLSLADAAALAELEGVAAVAPVIALAATARGPEASLTLAAVGTTPAYLEVARQRLLAGRAFAGDDELVLNQAAAAPLLGTSNSSEAVGMRVTLSAQAFSQVFTVVGIVEDVLPPFAQAGPGGADEARASPTALLPVGRALAAAGTERVAQIILSAESPDEVAATEERVQAALLERRDGSQDFRVSSLQEVIASFSEVFEVLTLFLTAIAGISLLVGGIGIMNIMLVTVTERTREIGVAKAIGATRRDVVLQFLVEAVVLSLIGGALGLLFAWLGTLVLQRGFGLPAVVTPSAVFLAVGVSAAIGVFFGVVPAWRAARLDPIEALRHQ